MAATLIATASPADFTATHLHSHHTNSFSRTRPTMFNKLKNKITSGKGKNVAPGLPRTPTPPPPHSNKHLQAPTPPTRRPSNSSTRSNPFQAPRAPAQPFTSNNPYSPFGNRGTDAPPAYSPAPNAAPTAQPPNFATSGTPFEPVDDPYSFLYDFDTIFLIDDSGSMTGSRWAETADALQAITPVCTAHDADGIDIYFLNHPDSDFHKHVKSSATVREIFQNVHPTSYTPLGRRLRDILVPYVEKYKRNPKGTKPINVICITDGKPSDDPDSVLIKAARELDRLDAPSEQVGVQFFQVGNDPGAKQYLQTLDDELAIISKDPDLRDIVDTVPFTGAEGTQLNGDGILKVVLGAVNRRMDRKTSKDLHRSATFQ